MQGRDHRRERWRERGGKETQNVRETTREGRQKEVESGRCREGERVSERGRRQREKGRER